MKQNRALYQRHRPTSFKEIFGQEAILTVLKNSIILDSVQNAYIFQGKYGTGKTSTARIFAAAINCPHFKENKEVCVDSCVSCVSIKNGHSDIIEIDAASNSGVDYIRGLKQEINLVPLELSRKVYILDEAHMLSKAAWDAMLKILEEPKLNVTFIFATTENSKIPKTIKSRCIELNFRNLSEFHIEDWISRILESENITFDKKALQVLLAVSDGSFRDALTLIDKKMLLNDEKVLTEESVASVANVPTPSEIKSWLKNMSKFNMEETIEKLKDFFKKGFHPILLARLSVSIAKKTLQNKVRTKEASTWVKIVETFYVFLKDSRTIFSPEISLEILILRFLLQDIVEEKVVVQKEVVEKKDVERTIERTIEQTMDQTIEQTMDEKTIVGKNDPFTNKFNDDKKENENKEEKRFETKEIEEITNKSIIKAYKRREEQEVENTQETVEGQYDNTFDVVEESIEIEETSEVEEDSIDLELSDTLIDLELNRKVGEENTEIRKMIIAGERKKQEIKNFEMTKENNTNSLERNKITSGIKIGDLAWRLLMSNYNKRNILVLPSNWKLELEGILAHLHTSFLDNSKEAIDVKNRWSKVSEFVLEEAQLPYSALLLECEVVSVSKEVIYITYNSPMRAALINRISRTEPFLSFIRKLLGKDYWIIAISRGDWIGIIKDYQEQAQASLKELKSFAIPDIPTVIDKSFRPAKVIKSKLLQELENDPELREYVIKEVK